MIRDIIMGGWKQTPQLPMILTYNTNLGPAGNTILLPIGGISGSVTVDWGDGTSETFTTTGLKTKAYSSAGIKTITISGGLTAYGVVDFTTAFFDSQFKITSVTQFNNNTKSFYFAFYQAKSLASVPTTLPVGVTDMSYMFCVATAFNQNIASWDTSSVIDMSYMFSVATSFNQNIGSWDTSSVIDMSYMFYGATAFNQNLSSWVTGLTAQPSSFSTGANATFANNANNLKPFLSGGTVRINT